MSTVAFDFSEEHASGRAISSLNQLVIVIGIVLPGLAALSISSVPAAALALALNLASLPWTHSGSRSTSVRLIAALILFLTILWSNWLIGSRDLEAAGAAAGRMVCVALPGLLLSAHIRPFPLGDALMQRLRLPPRPVLATVMALQRALLLAEQWQELGRVRRSRGIAGGGPIGRIRELVGRTVVFLVLSIRQATTLSIAMETRGMLAWERLGVERGHWETSRWRVRDSVTVALISVISLSVLVVGLTGL